MAKTPPNAHRGDGSAASPPRMAARLVVAATMKPTKEALSVMAMASPVGASMALNSREPCAMTPSHASASAATGRSLP